MGLERVAFRQLTVTPIRILERSHDRPMTPPLRKRYFSLLELLIVMTLIALVLGIAIPRMGYVPYHIQKTQTLKSLNIALHTAMNRAVASGSQTKLVLDINAHKATISEVSNGPKWTVKTEKKAEGPVADHFRKYSSFDLPKDLVLDEASLDRYWEDSQAIFHFFPSGEASGPVVPLLIGIDRIEVSVDALTGRPIVIEKKGYY
jgi:type II secretory pathway pseudopilin PulG